MNFLLIRMLYCPGNWQELEHLRNTKIAAKAVLEFFFFFYFFFYFFFFYYYYYYHIAYVKRYSSLHTVQILTILMTQIFSITYRAPKDITYNTAIYIPYSNTYLNKRIGIK